MDKDLSTPAARQIKKIGQARQRGCFSRLPTTGQRARRTLVDNIVETLQHWPPRNARYYSGMEVSPFRSDKRSHNLQTLRTCRAEGTNCLGRETDPDMHKRREELALKKILTRVGYFFVAVVVVVCSRLACTSDHYDRAHWFRVS